MKALTPYLLFNGNCQEAMNFYQACFGGKLEIMTNAEAPEDACPGNMKLAPNQIMHACLTHGDFVLMASDNPMDKPKIGDNLSLNINCSTKQQAEELFKALSADGKVTMPLADTFWGAYFGMLVDKYGFHWMLNCPLDLAHQK
ncbi:VOC family protein [Legionella brunensis]|uniref:PhnB protein n=1 Tax=Legionella brunensis TaxID=29422 RepID=A0A0W0SEC1_9GAMM|nr:VOC family protein [Legionella brunensis]KTC81497.1 PhnB protein [Legionella brunensis]